MAPLSYPLTESITWFKQLGSDDTNIHCTAAAAGKLRVVFTAASVIIIDDW